ncbi:MAG: hypothetical protein NVV59_11810 [Chitinophagaceae bacterium]|nr:hypothetical protein [Chitinophagaceae bacterium]
MVAHEAGHNWFQAALGTNERAKPWLDEGLNSCYDNRYSKLVNGAEGDLQIMKAPVTIQEATELLGENAASVRSDQPVNLSADKYSQMNYNIIVYGKTAKWFGDIANDIGQEKFDAAIQNYYRLWKFRHPDEQDLKKILEEAAGKNLDHHFAKLSETGPDPDQVRKGTRVAFPFSRKNIRETLSGKASHAMMISPAVGYNMYDKFMVGAFFTNITLPIPRFFNTWWRRCMPQVPKTWSVMQC